MKNDERSPILGPTNFWRIAVVAIVLVCGFATRLYDLADPPLDYAPTRQLRSAIIARSIYYDLASDTPQREQEIAQTELNTQEKLEPRIFESLVAFTYILAGGEYVWIARILSTLFWSLGGLALFYLSKEVISYDGAVIALIYYLFVPFGLLASRTFQPDPLMTAVIIWAWYGFYQWTKTRTWKWAWIAGLIAGFAIFIKSTAVFFLFFGMAAVVVSENRPRDIIKNYQIWLIATISVLPAVLYHLYGYFISGFIQDQFKGRLFNPGLWGDPDFYYGWLGSTSDVLGHLVIFLVALFGLFLIRGKSFRRFLLWSWIGYFIFGFAVSYYVTTHSYYLLPIIPLAAITIGAVADWIFIKLRKVKLTGLVWGGTVTALILGVALGYYIYQRVDYRHEPAYYAKVASFVSPDDKIIAMSQDYGFRLAYYGWIHVQPWSRLGNHMPEDGNKYSSKFADIVENFDFFIITTMKAFREQPDLNNELTEHYPILVEGGGYMIFDLRERQD